MPWLRWPIALLVLAVAWTGLLLPAMGWVVSTYPEPAFAVPATALVRADDGSRRCGAAHLERVGGADDGLWHLHLEGDAAERGWAHGQLTADLARSLELEMMGTFVRLVPGWPARHLVLGLVGLNNRTLPRYLHPDELVEMAADAAGSATWHLRPDNQPHFPVAVQYHALHDISHYLIDNPLVRPPQLGCTAVAVHGRRTADGRVLVGRLFDFEGGRAFDVDKVVQTVRPRDGLAFLSVAWPGATGAVTGLNAAGLWVSINAGETSTHGTVGRPTILAVREILQGCRTIAEAEAVLRRTPVFVSEAVLVASGPERRAVVVELGPGGCAVRESEDGALVVANHFCCDAWSADAANRRRLEQGTSPRRAARARELLDARPVHDPASLLALLRDRRAVGGVDVGFANRGTINAWIGAHLVIADLESRTVWVCAAPHGLGRAWAFTLDGPAAQAPLPAADDLDLYRAAFAPWSAAVGEAERALARGDRAAAADEARTAIFFNPGHFLGHTLLAASAGDDATRRREARRGLDAAPAYPMDRARLGALLAEPAR